MVKSMLHFYVYAVRKSGWDIAKSEVFVVSTTKREDARRVSGQNIH